MLRKILLSACLVVVLGALEVGAQEDAERKEAAPANKSAVIIVNNVPVLRKYYLTSADFNGSQALTACASGYHMASMFEILDTTQLSYNSSLGFTVADSGQGPPSSGTGWIRTGYVSSDLNCLNWTDGTGGHFGAFVNLENPGGWNNAGTKISPWVSFIGGCNGLNKVWCVQDLSN